MAPTRTTFPPTITASTWASAWGSAFERAQLARGKQETSDGTLAPPLSWADLAALARAWRGAGGASAWPTWAQWGALAYRWDPSAPSAFDASPARGRALVPADIAGAFWLETHRLAMDLDDAGKPARLDVDGASFGDPVWLAMVRADLAHDGAKLEWKIPIPGCKSKDGKNRPVVGCRPGWDLVEVSPGAFMCRERKTGALRAPEYLCDGQPVTIDDPITVVKKSLAGPLLILGAVWLLFGGGRPLLDESRRNR